jgi:hypothetical protein
MLKFHLHFLAFVMAATACKSRTRPSDSDVQSAALGDTSRVISEGNLHAVCSNYKAYDPYNAYIMAVHSDMSYLDPEVALPILTGTRGKAMTANIGDERVKHTPPGSKFVGGGFNERKVWSFSSTIPTGAKRTVGPDVATPDSRVEFKWKENPLPLEICYSPIHHDCRIKEYRLQEPSCQIPSNKGYEDGQSHAEKPIPLPTITARALKSLAAAVQLEGNTTDLSPEKIRELKGTAEFFNGKLRAIYNERIDSINRNYNLTKPAEMWTLKVLADEYTLGKRDCEFWANPKYDLVTKAVADTQATWAETDDFAILSFRGTEAPVLNGDEQDSIAAFLGNNADVYSDLLFKKVKCFDMASPTSGFFSLKAAGEMHRGFCEAAKVSFDWVSARVKAFDKPKKLFVTGHSLGGGIATIVYAGLMRGIAAKQGQFLKVNLAGLYTFGSPRVGNDAFAKEFTQMAKASQSPVFRNVDFQDVVTKAPYFNYRHVGELHWYAGNLEKVWKKNPMMIDSGAVSSEVVNAQVKVINQAVRAFWTLPYISLISQALGNFDDFKSQLEDHYILNYRNRLWPIASKTAGEAGCGGNAAMEIFDGGGLLDEAALRTVAKELDK